MSLRGYVKQLRPIQENYIKPDDKTQLFLLSEAKNASTYILAYEFHSALESCGRWDIRSNDNRSPFSNPLGFCLEAKARVTNLAYRLVAEPRQYQGMSERSLDSAPFWFPCFLV